MDRSEVDYLLNHFGLRRDTHRSWEILGTWNKNAAPQYVEITDSLPSRSGSIARIAGFNDYNHMWCLSWDDRKNTFSTYSCNVELLRSYHGPTKYIFRRKDPQAQPKFEHWDMFGSKLEIGDFVVGFVNKYNPIVAGRVTRFTRTMIEIRNGNTGRVVKTASNSEVLKLENAEEISRIEQQQFLKILGK